MRTARRTIAAAVSVTVFALGGAAAAGAGGQQVGPTQAPPVAALCDRVETALGQLQATRDRVVAALTTVQEQIDSGDLTRRQLGTARARRALLRAQLRFVDAAVARVQAWQERFCDAEEPPPPPPPQPPPGE